MQNDFQAKTKDSFPTMESLDQLAFDFKEMIRVREENHRLIEDLLVQRLRDEAKLVDTSVFLYCWNIVFPSFYFTHIEGMLTA